MGLWVTGGSGQSGRAPCVLTVRLAAPLHSSRRTPGLALGARLASAREGLEVSAPSSWQEADSPRVKLHGQGVRSAVTSIGGSSFSPRRPLEEPKVISAFSGKQAGKHVVHIACGSTYSAAITAEGELYTWGRGNYGRLGHGAWAPRLPSLRGASGAGLAVTEPVCLQAPVRTRPSRCWSPG